MKEALKKETSQQIEWVIRSPNGQHWRVLGQKHPESGAYHVWVTNAPREWLEIEDARHLYALRWQVELMFKGLKSVGRIHHLASSKWEVVKSLVLASLLYVVLSGWLREKLYGLSKMWQAPPLRVLRVMSQWMPMVLMKMGEESARFHPKSALDMLQEQCRSPDPIRPNAFSIPIVADFL